jgi:hypothetical protein
MMSRITLWWSAARPDFVLGFAVVAKNFFPLPAGFWTAHAGDIMSRQPKMK